MKNIILLITAIVAAAIALVLLIGRYLDPYQTVESVDPTSRYGQSLNIGPLSLGYPKNFILAMGGSNLLPDWPTPPCDIGFDYCLYYPEMTPRDPQGAGLRITARVNLNDKESCLYALPLSSVYEGSKPQVLNRTDYSTALWAVNQSASTSLIQSQKLYRIYTDSGCYELESRMIDVSDTKKVAGALNGVIGTLSFVRSKQKIFFPY